MIWSSAVFPQLPPGFMQAYGGDVTLTVDTDSNTVMLASGQTITGGAGFDSLSVQGSGIAAMASTSIEEPIFDGSTSEAIVGATGMAGLNTLTFSGQGTNAHLFPELVIKHSTDQCDFRFDC